VKRGEVWWADLRPPAGRRPVLLVSRDEAYAVRSQVTVAPITTTVRSIPVEVPLGPQEGLPRRCVANLDSLVTISKATLERHLATLPANKIREVDAAIRFALGLPEPAQSVLVER
jgi:mRNA interferase MazF